MPPENGRLVARAVNRMSPSLAEALRRRWKGRNGTRFKYPGANELEVTKSANDLDLADRMMLELRSKQPTYFLGVPMRQIPTDNWLLGELVFDLKPDYIIETGTLFGGSALYYASLLETIGRNGKVVTVDINEGQISKEAQAHDLYVRRVKFINGSSTDPEVIERIRGEVGTGKTVLVTIDTLHAPEHVRTELELYSQFVSPGSYLIVQDTYFEGLSDSIDGFLSSRKDFRRDPKLDQRFLITKYRGGFLKREKK